jgi:nicotinate-nucleotide adenylyltransferase
VTRDTRRRIGILGGTFDPIHVGHLALARAARDALPLDEVALLPTGQSWQKTGVRASAADRAEMARLAIAREPGLRVDDRETRRAGPSYTVDTLEELRDEYGPDVALVLLLGSDQLMNLPTWHRWRELLRFAHVACTQRERVSLATLPPELEELVARRGGQRLADAAAGSIAFFQMPPVPVSATALRTRLAAGDRPAELVPPAVLDYIDSHHLYGPLPEARGAPSRR